MSLSNYPPGVSDNTLDAPWNDPVVPEREFEITISQTLSKTVTVTTDNYIPEVDLETGHVYTNTSETDWYEVYEEQHLNIQELLVILKEYATRDLKNTIPDSGKGRELKDIIEACENWIVDDYCIEY